MFDVVRTAVPCPGCGIELAPSLLACPSCHALVHRWRLETIARDADSAKASNDYATAIALWR